MGDEKPFADVRELRPHAVEPSAVCVGDLTVSWHGCPTIARRAADTLNAAVAARERKSLQSGWKVNEVVGAAAAAERLRARLAALEGGAT